jgi:hypothetical protein
MSRTVIIILIYHCYRPIDSFYFGVLHPVAWALSRLSEEPSFATTVQGVYFTYILTATCFDPHWPSSSGTYNI